MLLTIADLLDDGLLTEIAEKLTALEWADGRSTAGPAARAVKRNEQAAPGQAAAEDIRAAIVRSLKTHPVIAAATRPRRFSRLLLSRTAEGGRYGPHVDNALMGAEDGQPMRTDLSFSVGLVPADSYEGGELTIHLTGQVHRVKPDLGEVILYPSTAIHEVMPVTAGTRIVAVGWVESRIADAAAREILFDLENLRATLRGNLPHGGAELLTLDKSIANLLRLFAAP